MSLTKFELEADAGGGRVIVDGEDLSRNVRAFTVQAQVGQAPVLTLVELGTGTIQGEGIVRVVPGEVRSGEAIAKFLDAIDAEELERAALSRIDFGESGTSSMLQVLKEWALGSNS